MEQFKKRKKVLTKKQREAKMLEMYQPQTTWRCNMWGCGEWAPIGKKFCTKHNGTQQNLPQQNATKWNIT